MNSSLFETVTGKLRNDLSAGPVFTVPLLSNSLPWAAH
jgi:hypothetical protein